MKNVRIIVENFCYLFAIPSIWNEANGEFCSHLMNLSKLKWNEGSFILHYVTKISGKRIKLLPFIGKENIPSWVSVAFKNNRIF